MPGVTAQHDDAIGQQQGFLNVMSHQKNRLRWNCLLVPQLHQLTAQILRRQHIEGRERLVHKEHFRLHHQGASESDPLPHSPGQLLGIRCLKTVETHRVQDLETLFAPLLARNSASHQRRFHVLQHRQPGKQGKALKDDAYVGVRLHNRLAVPENLARRRLGEAGQHAQQGRLS